MPTTLSLPFGGSWTKKKLARVEKYLVEYAKIMNKQPFRFAYVDAFAGTGYFRRESKNQTDQLPGFEDSETQTFADGSARVALRVTPRFDKYIFVEKDVRNAEKLKSLRTEFPDLADRIDVRNDEANAFLKDFCEGKNWRGCRAVVFLDPYGMQIEWATLEAIARTEAIDLWLLFPLGVGVVRLLPRDGRIPEENKKRLDAFFGTEEWVDAFYPVVEKEDLFGKSVHRERQVDFTAIKKFFVKRLKTIFVGVAENPLELLNSRNNPLYLLCFAASNQAGAPAALRIAQHILRP